MSDSNQPQLELDFDTVIRSATAHSREEELHQRPADEHAPGYSPLDQTAEYMRRAV